MKYRELAKKLSLLGCEDRPRKGGGSHRKWINPRQAPIVPVSVPDFGSKDLKSGTLRSIVKDLGLDWDEFMKA